MYLPAVAPPLASAGSIPPVPHASKPAVAAAAVVAVAVSMNQARRFPTRSLRLVLGSAVVLVVVFVVVVVVVVAALVV